MHNSFDCIFYNVLDFDRSISFYADVLGLKVESRDHVVRLSVDGVLVELVPAPGSPAIEGMGNGRLCLRVPDIHKAVAELKSRNVQVGDIHHRQNGMLCSLFDPDGNELALWQDA